MDVEVDIDVVSGRGHGGRRRGTSSMKSRAVVIVANRRVKDQPGAFKTSR